MKNPYAVSDFEDIRINDYYYIDRTNKIGFIEGAGKYLLFLRPRRFGKSLWLTTLKNYYDIAKADDFEKLFSGLWIGDNPTSLQNKYFVMEWDFSCIDCSGSIKEVKNSVYEHINNTIENFVSYYQQMLQAKIKIVPNNAMSSFSSLLSAVRQTGHKLYLFIDEYDNFANEMIARRREHDYFTMTALDGFMKTIFKVLKYSTKGYGLDRMFLTGVTPILLSDVTSGANINTDIHIFPNFADLCGFTDEEIKTLIKDFASSMEKNPMFPSNVFPKGKEIWIDNLYNLMKNLYDGYLFTNFFEKRIYNPSLVMYLLRQIEQFFGKLPENLIDHNLVADKSRLEFIADMDIGKDLILELNQNKTIEISKIKSRFGLNDMITESYKDRTFMGSYLYFMGMLTLGPKSRSGKQVLKIPNPVTQSLYIDGISRWLIPDIDKRERGLHEAEKFTTRGQLEPLRNYIEQQVFPNFHWRDRRWANELTIKTIFMTLLMDDENFLMISERQSRSGYADLAMLVRPDRREFDLIDILIEFKFIKTKDLKINKKKIKNSSDAELFELSEVEEKLKEAKEQAAKYSKELLDEFGDIVNLQTFAVISIGFERLLYKKI